MYGFLGEDYLYRYLMFFEILLILYGFCILQLSWKKKDHKTYIAYKKLYNRYIGTLERYK